MNNRDSIYYTADEYEAFVSPPSDYDPTIITISEAMEIIDDDVDALLKKMEEEKRTGNSQRIPLTSKDRQDEPSAIRSNSKASESNDRLRIGDVSGGNSQALAVSKAKINDTVAKKPVKQPNAPTSTSVIVARAFPKSKITPKKEHVEQPNAPTPTLAAVAQTLHPRRRTKLSDASTEPGYMKDTVSSSRRHANEN